MDLGETSVWESYNETDTAIRNEPNLHEFALC
jgi:hypothetical protein